MKFVTYQQYIEYLKGNFIMQIMERDIDYKILNTEEELYDEKRIKEVDKKHDKMFRSIVEHQSKVDQEMLLRIWEYVEEIIRTETITQETYLREDKVYPVVVPIVIYTGVRKWNAKTNFAQKQYNAVNFKKYRIDLEYNLIATQDYTFEELLEKGTLFASIMIMEKCRTKQDVVVQMNKVIDIIKDSKDREALSEIINYIVAPRIGRKKANVMLEKINEREETGMSPLTKMVLDWEREIKEEKENAKRDGRQEGRKEGKQEGRKEGILETAKKC